MKKPFELTIMFLLTFYGVSISAPMKLILLIDSANTEIRLPLRGAVDVTVVWGDGESDTYTSAGDAIHTYTNAGIDTVSIDGSLTQFGIGDDWPGADNLTKVIDFGTIGLTSLSGAFYRAESLTEVPDVLPTTVIDLSNCFCSTRNNIAGPNTWDVSGVNNTRRMFFLAVGFNQDIGNWDVSSITDMSGMFWEARDFDQDIGDWDVSSVNDMSQMFSGAGAFNQDIGEWDVSSVTNMSEMFMGADAFDHDIGGWDVNSVTDMNGMFGWSNFNQDIGSWDVSNVTDMSQMFYCANAFNQNIGAWDVSSVTNMFRMFSIIYGPGAFNQDIGGWDVSSVTDMCGMFDWTPFNQDISSWDVSNVTDMSSMFTWADSFNQDIGGWDVSSVTKMCGMFSGANAFNQDISGWDVSNVTNMMQMFFEVDSFDQDIGSWDISSVTDMYQMFGHDVLSTHNYNSLLIGWADSTVLDNVRFSGGESKYSGEAAINARNYLTETKHWEISDGGSTTKIINENSIDTKITKPGIYPVKNPGLLSENSFEFIIAYPSPADVIIAVYDCMGNAIDFPVGSTSNDGKTFRFSWGMCNKHGRKVGAGTYMIVAKVTNTDGIVASYKSMIGLKE